MNITEINPWSIVLAFGALQGYFLALAILLSKKGKKKANNLLSLLLILISLTLTESVLGMTGLLNKWPHLIFSTSAFFFLFGPVLFIYIKTLTSESYRFNYKSALHFLPFIICLIILIQFYSLLPDQKVNYLQELYNSGSISVRHLSLWNVYIVQLFIYVYLSFEIIVKYSKSLKRRDSGKRVVFIEGLRQTLTFFSIYLGVSIITILSLTFGEIYIGEIDLLSTLFLAVFIYWAAYRAINQPNNLFITDTINGNPSHTSEQKSKHLKNKNGNLKFRPSMLENNYENYVENLLHLMDEKKPYLKTELKISDLATDLNIPTHHLSQLLNEEFQKNFYDFVNKYRVDEASKRLVDKTYKNYSILGIALDAGFNSKSSFNRIFKKHTGMTPSTFIRIHN